MMTAAWRRIRRRTVLEEIGRERGRQVELGYTPHHDDQHGYAPLVLRAGNYARSTGTLPERREALIKAAALLVAAVDVLDRWAARP